MENNKNNPGQDGTMNNNNNPQNQNQNQKNQNDPSFDKNQTNDPRNDQNQNPDRGQENSTEQGAGRNTNSEEHRTNQDQKRYDGSKNPDGMDTNVKNGDRDFNEDIVNDDDRTNNKNFED